MVQVFTPLRWLAGALRRTWLVVIITVISCAAFAVRAASALVEHEPGPPARAAAPVAPARPAGRPARDGRQLVERDMFCSSCAPPRPGAAPRFVLSSAVLIETSLGGEPRATLRVLTTEVQGSWGVGDRVPGLGLLDRIAPTWVELVDPSGRRGRLSLREPAAGCGPAAAAGCGPDTAMSGATPAANPWADRFTKLDDQTYEVDRALVRELVGDASKLGGARFVPIIEHGAFGGIRLVGVRPNTLPHLLGLQSRDTLTAINGEPIRGAQQLIDLYATLDQLTAVELSGKRGGQPLVRVLRLR
jgi:hypothetical protein